MNKISKLVKICDNVIIGENVIIEDDVYIDYNVIIRDHVTIKKGTFIGANCILGEFTMDFINTREKKAHSLIIGEHSCIRSGTIIYEDNSLGDYLQTGHNVTIREHSHIGSNCSFGTLSDVQGNCEIGDYVRCHSNVHIGQKSKISSYVWIFPYVVLTNDPTPPSNDLVGVSIDSFAIISTGAVILPGIHIASNALVAAKANVTKHVNQYEVVGGNPAKVISDVRKIKNHISGEPAYPWQYHFERGMPWEGFNFDEWDFTEREKNGGDHE